MSRIIFLNGASSSGKTSIARAIQYLSNKPWITFGIDTFINMTPLPVENKDTGDFLAFVPGKNNNGLTTKVEVMSEGKKLFSVMADFADLLARNGNDIIIDEVLMDDESLKPYINKLSKYTVYFVALYCDLPVLQEREILRCNRRIGLSNDQVGRVHSGLREYDITFNTANVKIFEVAQDIIKYVESNKRPIGFHVMKKRMMSSAQ